MRDVSFDDLLRDAGLKVTAPRKAVLESLTAVGEHLDADTVLTRVRAELPKVSPQTIYGVLASLSEAGLQRKIEPAGSAALYESRIGDNHHHLVCTQCKRVSDVDCVVGAAPCLTPSDANGYEIHAAEVTFWGVCPDCRAQSA